MAVLYADRDRRCCQRVLSCCMRGAVCVLGGTLQISLLSYRYLIKETTLLELSPDHWTGRVFPTSGCAGVDIIQALSPLEKFDRFL